MLPHDMSTCHVDSCGTWDDTGGYSGFATTAASEFLTRNGSPPSQICGSLSEPKPEVMTRVPKHGNASSRIFQLKSGKRGKTHKTMS